jgi:8-oxo-dGTP pyrophosphatase MutT (NUDIX family)
MDRQPSGQNRDTFIEDVRKALALHDKQTLILRDVPLSPAAVLVPLLEKEGEFHILLTKRTETVGYHKGQICFPGGGRHETDRDLKDTALRETFEEVGVKPEDVRVLGELDSIGTVSSNFLITPYVGVIPYPYESQVSVDEIESLIEVPLSALRDEKNYREEVYDLDGSIMTGFVFEYQGEVIWGATARILRQLIELVFPVGGDSVK